MGHEISAFIARADALRQAVRELPHAHVVGLRQAFAALPVTDEFHDETIAKDRPLVGAPPANGLLLMETTSFGVKLSQKVGPVAYVETHYFGGAGFQFAMAWNDGEIICPLEKSGIGPINRALIAIGVEPLDGDAFDSIGLAAFRRIEAMIERAER
jgi:hypothetical protein